MIKLFNEAAEAVRNCDFIFSLLLINLIRYPLYSLIPIKKCICNIIVSGSDNKSGKIALESTSKVKPACGYCNCSGVGLGEHICF